MAIRTWQSFPGLTTVTTHLGQQFHGLFSSTMMMMLPTESGLVFLDHFVFQISVGRYSRTPLFQKVLLSRWLFSMAEIANIVRISFSQDFGVINEDHSSKGENGRWYLTTCYDGNI